MSHLLKTKPSFQKPREKLLERGASSLTDAELLAIILRTGYEGHDVLDVAQEVLKKHSLSSLMSLSAKQLASIKGIGPTRATSLHAAFEMFQRISTHDTIPTISSAQDAIHLVSELREKKREHLVALYLDARDKLLKKYTVSIGIVNGSIIHPREVFHEAIVCNASSVILIHNHPSDSKEPSDEDIMVTKRIIEAGKLLGIPLKDHIILTRDSFKSIIRDI